MDALQISVVALKEKLETFEKSRGLPLESVDARIVKIKSDIFYRRYFVELFLKFKAIQTVERETPVSSDAFYNDAQTMYLKLKGQKEVTKSAIWQWARRSSEAEELRTKHKITKSQVGELMEGNTISSSILGDIVVSIDVLLAVDINMQEQDYGQIFSDHAVDFSILKNLLASKKFMANVKPSHFTQGVVNLIAKGRLNGAVLSEFQKLSNFDQKISYKVLSQVTNLKKLKPYDKDLLFLLESETQFARSLESYLENASTKEHEQFYSAAPLAFAGIAKKSSRFVEFVKSKINQNVNDIGGVFNKDMPNFQIEMHLFALSNVNIPILEDSTKVDKEKIEWLSKIHSQAFNKWILDQDSIVSRIIQLYIKQSDSTQVLLKTLNGDSLLGIFRLAQKLNITVELPQTQEGSDDVLGIAIKELSEATDQKAAVAFFEQLVRQNKPMLAKIKRELNEALSNFIPVLEKDLFEFLDNMKIVLKSTKTKFDNRMAMETDVVYTEVSQDIKPMQPTTVLKDHKLPNHKSPENAEPSVVFTPKAEEVDSTCNNWYYINIALTAGDFGIFLGTMNTRAAANRAFNARNHANRNNVNNAMGGNLGVVAGGLLALFSEIGRWGYKIYYNIGSNCIIQKLEKKDSSLNFKGNDHIKRDTTESVKIHETDNSASAPKEPSYMQRAVSDNEIKSTTQCTTGQEGSCISYASKFMACPESGLCVVQEGLPLVSCVVGEYSCLAIEN